MPNQIDALQKIFGARFPVLRGWRWKHRSKNDHLICPPGKFTGDHARKPKHAAYSINQEPIKPVMA
jgi:hypothetical protein